MITLPQLKEVFAHQLELAHKFHPIEEKNTGKIIPLYPMTINSPPSQERIRQFAWWVTEEFVEAMTATTDGFAEEMSDILHFSVEICLMCGIPPEDVLLHQELDAREPEPQIYVFEDVIVHLGKAINLLKMKPWKQTPKHTHVPAFRFLLSKHLYILLYLFKANGLDPHSLYFKKNEINQQRIITGV